MGWRVESPPYRNYLLSIVADGERGADVESPLRCRGLFVVLGLFVEIDVSFVIVVLEKVRSFIQADAAWRAGCVDVP